MHSSVPVEIASSCSAMLHVVSSGDGKGDGDAVAYCADSTVQALGGVEALSDKRIGQNFSGH